MIQMFRIQQYANEDEQRDRLAQWLRELKALGYRSQEITVLSFRSAEQSVAARLEREGFKLAPAWRQTSAAIPYASVHAFKGMENKVATVAGLVAAGFKDGEVVVARKVSPDRAIKMAEQLKLVQAHARLMENELRRAAAQAVLH